MTAPNPQIIASDPDISAFVTANAGSGKTRTLVDRVARLLLRGARPQAILCVTFTKAAAAEMQRRLFAKLGDWAVMPDEPLATALAEIDEIAPKLDEARKLFAKALETPGGLKIQTIHAFCEALLRRFPLEAGVAPAFNVIDDQAGRDLSAEAQRDVALAAAANPGDPLGEAYARLAADLDFRTFAGMFATFEGQRRELQSYLSDCEQSGGVEADVWKRCGFDQASGVAAIEGAALASFDWDRFLRTGRALLEGSAAKDAPLGERMLALCERHKSGKLAAFSEVWALFCTQGGKPLSKMATQAVDAQVRDWLTEQQAALGEACEMRNAAIVAEDTVAVLTLAAAYIGIYEGLKARLGGLDFGDLIDRAGELLTRRADAAWVLFKLDGGLDHILLDEAQDTSPGQWTIVDALAEEFFAGEGVRPALKRTAFAVGDEKQSIFSFQGARPDLLLKQSQRYERLADGSGGVFKGVPLNTSYRSAPEVLDFVDAVFADQDAVRGLRPDSAMEGELVTHIAHRAPGFGGVEIWPLEHSEKAEEQDVWAPLDTPSPDSANKKLARKIASHIKDAIARGDAVYVDEETTRPAGPQDFMILVRRRGALFHEIIRALKKAGVAVGGADRLKLTDHIAYLDLLALARFVLFPADDLNLAALLRSPLFDVDEDSLYALAQPRGGRSLWSDLCARKDEGPEWADAHALLSWAKEASRTCAPFDFYGRLLCRAGPDGCSMRARILTRLGREAEDALEAFVAETLAAEQRGARDFETFAAQMAASEIEVKREQEDGKGYVRVMTAHGAKGLEAPIVILPDTTGLPPAKGSPLLRTRDGGWLWCASAAGDCPASAEARTARKDAMMQESLRLLYVGLTRARDRLIVCGTAMSNRKDGFEQGSWWDFVTRAASGSVLHAPVETAQTPDGLVTRIGYAPIIATSVAAAETAGHDLPAWLKTPPAPEPPAARYASPSRLADEALSPAPSPLARMDGLGRYRRGDLVHKLLQLLPDVAPDRRAAAAERMLARERDLSAEQRAEIAAAVFGVLDDARFAEVFGPGSRAEVAVAGGAGALLDGLKVSGRLDRLVVTPDRVLVVDYKSNRPSPDRIEDAADAYILQMAVYAAVLREIFPGKQVEAALVWTDGPKLTPVPESVMTARLAALRSAG